MKKFYKELLLLALAILILPASCLLVGCGATAVNQAQGVSFVSNVQDEKGNAVFELDLGSPLKLPYKINPSSAYGYAPRFTAVSGISGDNMETFSLDIVTGEFCINRADFKDVEVEINVGSFKDTCKITLKDYPTQIGIYDETQFNKINTAPKINLACGSAYQINIAGVFEDSAIIDEETGEKQPRLLIDSDYNFLIEVDDNSKTIINVPNKNRLNLVAYDNYGKAKIKVFLCDYYNNKILDEEGNETLAFELEINVYMQCDSMDVYFSGANQIVSSNNQQRQVDIKVTDLEYSNAKQAFVIDYNVAYYDKFDRMIEFANLKSNLFVDSKIYVSVDNDNNKIFVKKPPSGSSLSIAAEIWTNAPLSNGEFCMLDVVINIIF